VAQIYDQKSAADHRGEIVILAVVEGSPAGEAGLHAGQIICSVDGVPTKGRQFKSVVVEGLRGAVGTYVNLRIRSGPSRRPRKVRILRDAIRLTRQKEVRECKVATRQPSSYSRTPVST